MKMNLKFVVTLVAACAVAAGCVGTVNDRKTAAVPFVKDSVEGRYERSAAQAHEAAKSVLQANGTLLRDETLLGGTNTVYALEGKVNQRNVWVRVEELEPRLTKVVVQVRTRAGGTDLEWAHEIEKQIALKLVR